MKIAVLASFNMDLVMRAARLPAPGETLQGEFAMFLGGKGFNQAVAARRLGANVAVVGRVGDDDFGAAFLDALDAEAIDRQGVSIDGEVGTGVASIVVDDGGENAIIQSPRANRALGTADVLDARAAIDGADVALAQFETSADAVGAFAAAASDAGCLLMLNAAPAHGLRMDRLPTLDYIVANETEALALTAAKVATEPAALAHGLRNLGPPHAVVTLGPRGVVAAGPEHIISVPALVVDVVDTVGAGDAFCAAFAVRIAEGAALADAARFACAAGALACTRPGAEPSMPRRAEVDELLAKGVTT